MKRNTQMTRAAVPASVQNGVDVRADGRAYAQINPDEYRVVKSGADSFLLFTVLSLLVFGLVMVFSASYADAQARYGDSYYFIKRQSVMVCIGLVFMIVASRIPLRMYKWAAVPAYIASALLLVAVLFMGDEGGGAQRWIKFGSLRFQPSEIAKYALILTLAWYYQKYESKAFDFKDKRTSNLYGTLFPLCLIGLICGLVMLEKHLSGIIIIGTIGLMVMFASGIRLKLLGAFGAVAVAGVAAMALLTDYTKRRIDIWLNPAAYPQDGGWQTLQGMRAIGSGGFFGLGQLCIAAAERLYLHHHLRGTRLYRRSSGHRAVRTFGMARLCDRHARAGSLRAAYRHRHQQQDRLAGAAQHRGCYQQPPQYGHFTAVLQLRRHCHGGAAH